jgi:hypothetical protein
MSFVQCLGGWCKRRESCAHYHAPPLQDHEPSERLCPPGEDQPEPIKPARETTGEMR